MAQRPIADAHHVAGFEPTLGALAAFAEAEGQGSPRLDPSLKSLQDDTGLDAAGWIDVWLAAAV
jgi:hypothetical protein